MATDTKYALPYKNAGNIWPFPEKLCIEPRIKDGTLDVQRIGRDKIAVDASRVKTSDQLAKMFYSYNPTTKYATGQEVMNWLCDNGLVARPRYW